jgi:iron complex outermembrane recepter protein
MKRKSGGASLKLTWNIGDNMELVSISAYESVEKFFQEDPDASAAIGFPDFLTNYTVDAEQFTQELRLSGSSEKLNWVVGGFYYDDDKDNLAFNPFRLVDFLINVVGVPAAFADIGIRNDSELDSKSWALFGQAEYALTDNISFIGGVRYTDEEKDLLQSNNFAAPAFVDNEEINTDNVTWKAGLDWRPLEDTLLYFNVSKGFKSGAFKTSFAGPGAGRPVAEETLIAYEGGVKTDLFDNRLRLNASIFYSDYEDMQAVSVAAIGGVPVATLVNVGDVDIVGMEIEATASVTDNLEVVWGLGLLDSQITSTVAAFDGNDVAFNAKVSTNGIVRYRVPSSVMNGNVTLTTSFTYMDDHFITVENHRELAQESYLLWGARVNWTSQNERYYGEVFVDNILDEEINAGGFNVGDFSAVIWGKPRWAGVKVGFNFN